MCVHRSAIYVTGSHRDTQLDHTQSSTQYSLHTIIIHYPCTIAHGCTVAWTWAVPLNALRLQSFSIPSYRGVSCSNPCFPWIIKLYLNQDQYAITLLTKYKFYELKKNCKNIPINMNRRRWKKWMIVGLFFFLSFFLHIFTYRDSIRHLQCRQVWSIHAFIVFFFFYQ